MLEQYRMDVKAHGIKPLSYDSSYGTVSRHLWNNERSGIGSRHGSTSGDHIFCFDFPTEPQQPQLSNLEFVRVLKSKSVESTKVSNNNTYSQIVFLSFRYRNDVSHCPERTLYVLFEGLTCNFRSTLLWFLFLLYYY